MEFQDKVCLMVCRHDEPYGDMLSPKGAMNAYFVGKHAAMLNGVDIPSHIFFSPFTRTRETAKMHQIAMKTAIGYEPSMSMDLDLHQDSETPVKEMLSKFITAADETGIATLELVTHEPNMGEILRYYNQGESIGLGAFALIKAPTWEDMAEKKNVEVKVFRSSAYFMESEMGKEQFDLLKIMTGFENQGSFSVAVSGEDLENMMNAQVKKAKVWLNKAVAGQNVSPVSPVEYVEVFDAYKFWMNNMALSVGLPQLDEGWEKAKSSVNKYNSELAKKLLGAYSQSFGERYFINDDNYDDSHYDHYRDPGYAHPILNAALKKMEKKLGIEMSEREAGNQVAADMLEDFPGYRDTMKVGKEDNAAPNKDGSLKQGIGRYYVADGDDGEHHPMLNAHVYKMMKKRGDR